MVRTTGVNYFYVTVQLCLTVMYNVHKKLFYGNNYYSIVDIIICTFFNQGSIFNNYILCISSVHQNTVKRGTNGCVHIIIYYNIVIDNRGIQTVVSKFLTQAICVSLYFITSPITVQNLFCSAFLNSSIVFLVQSLASELIFTSRLWIVSKCLSVDLYAACTIAYLH